MPKLIVDHVSAGIKIKKASLDTKDARKKLDKDPIGYFKGVANLTGIKVHVHYNSDAEIHLVIPDRSMVTAVINSPDNGPDKYDVPDEYDSLSPNFIDPDIDKEKAYHFRLGDYCFAQCG